MATAVGGGGIELKVILENSEQAVAGGAILNKKTATSKTVQSGGSIRLELGDDPKDLNWVVVTVHKAK